MPSGDQPVRFWREPLSALCTAATDAGFLIEKVIEPVPAGTMRERYPEDYEKLTYPAPCQAQDVPVAGDLGRVLLVEHRVEDRLSRAAAAATRASPKPRPKPAPPARSDATTSRCRSHLPRLMMPTRARRQPLALMPARSTPVRICREGIGKVRLITPSRQPPGDALTGPSQRVCAGPRHYRAARDGVRLSMRRHGIEHRGRR